MPRPRSSLGLALMVSAILSLPYLLAVHCFFSSDDWVYLTWNRAIPPWQFWRYFSPGCVWFYRPLQALQFGWLYHAVGLQPLAYNLSLWVMHLGVCLLVYSLAWRLTTQRMALLTTALFAAQWVYVEVVLWPSNFSTLHWALVTLALCLVFLRWLQSRRSALLLPFYGLFLLNFCAKETAVNAPLLLGALWWWHSGNSGEQHSRGERLREGAVIFAPLAAITVAYLGFHRYGIHDVYQGAAQPSYQWAPPAQIPRQFCCAFNHLLLSFYGDPLVMPLLPRLQTAVEWVVWHGYFLPLLLGAVAWRSRDRLLGFGLLWIVASLIPTIGLVGFHTSRFYYLPAIGAALVLARGGQWVWQKTAAETRWRPFRLAIPLGFAYLMIVNLSLASFLCLQVRDDSRLAEAAFHALRQAGPRLPRGSLIVLAHPPGTSFAMALGVREMVCMALRDPTAQGVVAGEHLPDVWLRRFQQMPSVYVLDFARRPLILRPAAPTRSIRQAAGHRNANQEIRTAHLSSRREPAPVAGG